MQEKQLNLFEDGCKHTLEKDSDGRFFVQGKRKKTYILNLAGERFGKLLALEPKSIKTYKDGSNKVVWKLICDCGNEHETTSNALSSGKTKSCGCLKSEISVENSLKSRDKLMKKDAALRSFFSSYKSSAKTRNLEFDLSLEEFEKITSKPCEYCGILPNSVHRTKHSVYKNNGIDRVDNTLGYVKDNVVACCSICNHAKSTLPKEVFINWAIDVATHQRDKLSFETNRDNSISNLLIQDLKAREKVGFRKYGRFLTRESEEDMLIEVYEEIQDALLYLKALSEKRQAIYERDNA